MRFVAVSIVKNEADIIEAFVRHTHAWVDHHLIFDHDSTDGTREILAALKTEGLPITLFADDLLENLQQIRSNHLTRLAVEKHAADWVFPLDADEIFTGPGRVALENALSQIPSGGSASVSLLNYYPTAEDDQTITNPVLRLRYCQISPPRTRKVIVPRELAAQPEIYAGKGSHALYRGGLPLADQPLPPEFHLCHLALRSQPHQALRVILAELQKLSRGQAHAGLDVHYRLGFQLLSENPDLFFATVVSPAGSLKLKPIPYCGTPVRPQPASNSWNRIARALLPYLEKLATSHGVLTDRLTGSTDEAASDTPLIKELVPTDFVQRDGDNDGSPFSGFSPLAGWGGQEGPVPEAFLPVFHWGYAPATQLAVEAGEADAAWLIASGLTYSENQRVRVTLNGITLLERAFPRTNQKEKLEVLLPLRAGKNELSFHYDQSLVTEFDPRKLAMIFLSLKIVRAQTP